MPEVRRTTTAPCEAVWAVLADPDTYPDWLVGAQVMRRVDGDFPNPGSEFHHAVGATEGLALPDKTTALDAEPGRSLTLKVRARPFFQGRVRFLLEPVDGGTDIVMEEEPLGPLKLLRPALTPLINARNGRSLEQLAELVEGRSAPAE